MPSPALFPIRAQPAPRRAPMSPSSLVDPRRRARPLRAVSPLEAAEAWARFVAETTGSREACAMTFGVTFQCACNWFDGVSRPYLDKVMLGARLFPAAFDRHLREGR